MKVAQGCHAATKAFIYKAGKNMWQQHEFPSRTLLTQDEMPKHRLDVGNWNWNWELSHHQLVRPLCTVADQRTSAHFIHRSNYPVLSSVRGSRAKFIGKTMTLDFQSVSVVTTKDTYIRT